MRIDHTVVNTINKRDVLRIIRNHGPISKAEISRMTELSIPTIMRLTDDLIDKGIVRVVGKGESTGGKPPLMLELAADAYYLVGIDVGTTNIKTIVMDMEAKIISRIITPTVVSDSPEKIIVRIIDTIEEAVSDSGKPLNKILGIGLGMPGLLDIDMGKVLFSPDFRWENVDLIGPIKERFNMPVYMINVTRAMAMSEKWFGLAKDIKNFMCINLGYGIGAAIVIDDELYGGGSDSSGEFGHMTLEKNGPQCDCGNYGCLEALASANAISKKAGSMIERGEESIILSMAGGDAANIDAKMIYDAAKHGDNLAMEIVRESNEYIGIAIANVINFLDPELIIFEGGVAKAGDILLNGIKSVVERRQMKYTGRKLKILISELGDDAAAIGAASVLIGRLFESGGRVDKLDTDAM